MTSRTKILNLLLLVVTSSQGSLYSMARIQLINNVIVGQVSKIASCLKKNVTTSTANNSKTTQVILSKDQLDVLADEIILNLSQDNQLLKKSLPTTNFEQQKVSGAGLFKPTQIALAPDKPSLLEPLNQSDAKKTLEITSENPTEKEIIIAFKKMSLKYYADVNTVPSDFKNIKKAKEFLLTKEKNDNSNSSEDNNKIYSKSSTKKPISIDKLKEALNDDNEDILTKYFHENQKDLSPDFLGSLLQHVSTAKQALFLIKNGADINAQDQFGNTALMTATNYYKNDVVETLIKAGADLNLQNENGDNALIIAARHSNYSLVRVLIKAGADLNLLNKNGESLLKYMLNK